MSLLRRPAPIHFALFTASLALSTGAGCYLYTTLPGPNVPTDFNVIFITVDGVRWQEFFNGSDPQLTPNPQPLFTQFWSDIAPRGTAYGNPSQGSQATVANGVSISLPAYMNIFAGSAQNCIQNDCSRIQTQTFLDRIADELGYTPMESAVFASWRQLAIAVSSRDDVATVNVSHQPYDDGSGDPALDQINQDQVTDTPPWGPSCPPGTPGPDEARPCGDVRWDKYTWRLGMRFLVQQRPRFMYLSLNDSDGWGHAGNYPAYVQSLQDYDDYLTELFETLDSMEEYGRNTAVILTTDHGRGNWDQWDWHGPAWPSSNKIFLYMKLPENGSWQVRPPSRTLVTHSDIRPTIETILGLGVRGGSELGTSLATPVNTQPTPESSLPTPATTPSGTEEVSE